jgi:hypothetical protein
MKDQLEDQVLVIQEQEAKMNLLRDETKILKDNQENMQRKFDDIYENHILIAKQGESKNMYHHEEEEQKSENRAIKNI